MSDQFFNPLRKPKVSEEDENSSNVTLITEEPQFCGFTEYEDVKDLIEKWIKSCDGKKNLAPLYFLHSNIFVS